MLIARKTIQLGDIVTLRLVSGEEVVGSYQSADTTTIRLSKPLCVIIQMVGQQEARMQLAPFAASLDDTHEIPFLRSALVFDPVLTKDDVAQGYRRMTSSLALPPRGLIT